MFIEPTQHRHELFFQTVAPERELILFRAVGAYLRAPAGLYPFRPHIAHELIGKHSELIGLARSQFAINPLGAVPLLGKHHTIAAWRYVVKGSAGR